MSSHNSSTTPNGPSTPFQPTGPVGQTPAPITTHEPATSVAGKTSMKREDRALPEPDWQSDKVGREELNARLLAADAKTEMRIVSLQGDMRVGFSELRGESKLILEKMSAVSIAIEHARSEQRASRLWIIGTIIVVASLTVATVLADRANILASMQTAFSLTQAQPHSSANTPSTAATRDAPAPRP